MAFQTTVTGPIRPKFGSDVYPTTYANEGYGGCHNKASISQRDAIPVQRRYPYMLCTVENYGGQPAIFWLATSSNLADNTKWELLPLNATFTGGVVFKGTFSAVTGLNQDGNAIADLGPSPVGTTNGFFYVCTESGTIDFGSGNQTFNTLDWVIYEGTTWRKIAQAGLADWNTIANKPAIIDNIATGVFVPVEESTHLALVARVDALELISLTPTDTITGPSTSVTTETAVYNYAYSQTYIDALETTLTNAISLGAAGITGEFADIPARDAANTITNGEQWQVLSDGKVYEFTGNLGDSGAIYWTFVYTNLVNVVTSVFGRTGAVTAQAGDYSSDQITNDSLSWAGASVTAALDSIGAYLAGIPANTIVVNDINFDTLIGIDAQTLFDDIDDQIFALDTLVANLGSDDIINDSTIPGTTVSDALDNLADYTWKALYVDPNVATTGSGTRNSPFKTIEEAVVARNADSSNAYVIYLAEFIAYNFTSSLTTGDPVYFKLIAGNNRRKYVSLAPKINGDVTVVAENVQLSTSLTGACVAKFYAIDCTITGNNWSLASAGSEFHFMGCDGLSVGTLNTSTDIFIYEGTNLKLNNQLNDVTIYDGRARVDTAVVHTIAGDLNLLGGRFDFDNGQINIGGTANYGGGITNFDVNTAANYNPTAESFDVNTSALGVNLSILSPSTIWYVDTTVAAGGVGTANDPFDTIASVPSPGSGNHATIHLSGNPGDNAGTLTDATAGVSYAIIGDGGADMTFTCNVTGVGSSIHTHGLDFTVTTSGNQTYLVAGGQMSITSWSAFMNVTLQEGAVLNNASGASIIINLTASTTSLIMRQSAFRSILHDVEIRFNGGSGGDAQWIESTFLNSASTVILRDLGSGTASLQFGRVRFTGDLEILNQSGNGAVTLTDFHVDGQTTLTSVDSDLTFDGEFVSVQDIDWSGAVALPTYDLHGTQLEPDSLTEAQSGGLVGPPTTEIVEQFELLRDSSANRDSGVTFAKVSYSFVNVGGSLYVDAETDGGGDITVLLNGTRYVLDATTGSGAGGKLRSANGITFTGASTTAKTVYIYFEETSYGNAQLTLSETSPSVGGVAEFAWGGVTIIRDATTFGSIGVDLFQRYNDGLFHGGRGMLSYEREKIRQLGGTWKSGAAINLNIDATSTPDDVEVGVDAGTMYQLHLQSFSAITSPATMFCLNHPTTPYLSINGLEDITVDATGASLLTNGARFRFTLVLFVNSQSVGTRIGVLLPLNKYNNNSDAYLDIAGYDITALPSEVAAAKGCAILLGTVVLRYSTAAGGEYFNVVDEETGSVDGYIDRRGEALGATGSGGGVAQSQTQFSTANFLLFDSSDSSKELDFDLSAITTLTTRTITVPDEDVNLTRTVEGILEYDDGLTTDDIQAVSLTTASVALRDDGAGNGVARITAADLIVSVKNGTAPYTYFLRRNGGAFGAGNADPRSEFIAFTSADVGTVTLDFEVTDNGALSSGIHIGTITITVTNPDSLT